MFGSLDISTSGLIVQRQRLEVISANIANQNTLLNEAGDYEPYRRRIPMIAAGDPTTGAAEGVHLADIALDEGALMAKLEPGSPFADADGYVYYPNIDPIMEQVNAMNAARSYEANVAAIEATKSMIGIALQMIG